MSFLTLIPCALVCVIGAFVTYQREWVSQWWCPWLFGVLALISGVMYGFGVRWTRSDEEAFVFSAAWDVAVTAVYIVVPLVWCGVRLTSAGWIGVVLVGVGLVMLKTVGTAK